MNVLIKLYKGNDSDTLITVDTYTALGKDPNRPEDVSYVASMVSLVNVYKLVTVNYSVENGVRRRVSTTLTDEGRTALNRGPSSHPGRQVSQKPKIPPAASSNSHEVTITSVRRDIEKLKLLEPELDILFDIKLKELPM
ncbi:MAG TPA: hypothetical protein VGM08_00300 [Candidatus Saccharimonadales bacterium]